MWLPLKLCIVSVVSAPKKIRCVVCGKEVTPKQQAVRITKGSQSIGWRLWGTAHKKCFAIAVDSPGMVIEELRSTAHESRAGGTEGRA